MGYVGSYALGLDSGARGREIYLIFVSRRRKGKGGKEKGEGRGFGRNIFD